MRLLVSPMNIDEARAALAGGADILDVKNPKEGSLGANFPWAIREVADLAAGKVPVSATIGDLDYKPGTASLAALGAAVSGADYIKAGLLGGMERQARIDVEEARQVDRAVDPPRIEGGQLLHQGLPLGQHQAHQAADFLGQQAQAVLGLAATGLEGLGIGRQGFGETGPGEDHVH